MLDFTPHYSDIIRSSTAGSNDLCGGVFVAAVLTIDVCVISITSVHEEWFSIKTAISIQLFVAMLFILLRALHSRCSATWAIATSVAILTWISLTSPHLAMAALISQEAVMGSIDGVALLYFAKIASSICVISLCLAPVFMARCLTPSKTDKVTGDVILFYVAVIGATNLAADLVDAKLSSTNVKSIMATIEQGIELVSAAVLMICCADPRPLLKGPAHFSAFLRRFV